jgi:transcriptional regulator with XRE-family HTH domain
LAATVGLTQDAISLYERGTRSMRVETLVRIARALDVPLSILLDTHPDVLVIRDTPVADLLARAAESSERLRAFRDIWEFLRAREEATHSQ